jgi:hypothetical protein
MRGEDAGLEDRRADGWLSMSGCGGRDGRENSATVEDSSLGDLFSGSLVSMLSPAEVQVKRSKCVSDATRRRVECSDDQHWVAYHQKSSKGCRLGKHKEHSNVPRRSAAR